MRDTVLIKGSELKIKLKKKKVKLEEFANHYGLVRTTISRYLNDHMAMPASFIIQVADYTGMEIKDFMRNKDEDIDSSSSKEYSYADDDQILPAEDIQESYHPDEKEIFELKEQDPEEYNRENKLIDLDSTKLETYIHRLESRIQELEKKINNQ